MTQGLMARGLEKVRGLLKTDPEHPLSERQLQKLREQLQECAVGQGGEVSARQRAARLGQSYLQLDDNGRHAFLRLIALEFGPQPEVVAAAHAAYQTAVGTPGQWDAEARLRSAMRSRRIRILTQFNALPQGVKFLVDLRTDLLRYLEQDPELGPLDRELENRLTAWFDVGFLELRRITWQSPAALLEKLIQYEAVHAIRSWTDMKNRLDSDRRCYAFFHPRMPEEPLIFVEVALTSRLADNVQALLDENAPVFDSSRADTAIFYSISNTQDGLRGISFGNFLLKRVIDDLKRDFPRLNQFATLSPLPQFRRWAEKADEHWEKAFHASDLERIAKAAAIPAELAAIRQLLTGNDWAEQARVARALQQPLTRLAARYLLLARSGTRLHDPVARFHLGNGARVERLNFLADTSPKGYKQSFGMMVNYLYAPEEIEENVENLLRNGRIAAATGVRCAIRDR
ncbi:MAG: hypothetical protein RIR00_1623 [Pseudomonadota bacterium]|jgi:malonyl-CoA decarboxylase